MLDSRVRGNDGVGVLPVQEATQFLLVNYIKSMSDDSDGIDRPRGTYELWRINSPGGCLAFLGFLLFCLIVWAIYDWFD
jgi:hypothetical protein